MKTMLCFFLLALCLNIASAQVLTSLKNEDNLSLESLKAFVIDNNIKTLDELIPNLPEHMLSNTLLVYNSKALNLPRVTPETPRVIMFNKKASLILAFTKHPGDEEIASGRDTLEVIAINNKTRQYEFFDIPFDGKNTPFKTALQPNPALCLTCHGQNPRPIFNDYNSWPGFYGSFSSEGDAVIGTKEYEYFDHFLNTRKSLKRYEDLQLDHVQRKQLSIAIPPVGYEGNILDNYTPALIFGTLIEVRMFEKLAKRLESIPSSQNYMSLISYLARSNECGSEYSHRTDAKKLYSYWINSKNYTDQANAIARLIEDQVLIDLDITSRLFSEFNFASKRIDSRGNFNTPYLLLVNDFGLETDRGAFQATIIFMESIGRALGLKSEDFSTTPGRPTAGIFHVRGLGIVEDEQMFKGLYEGLVNVGSPLIAKQKTMTCSDLEKAAQAEVQNLTIANPKESGIFYYR